MSAVSRFAGLIEKFEDGPIWTIDYLVYDPEWRECVVIDVPLWSSDKIYKRVKELNLKMRYIIATHGHWDHIGEMRKLKSLTEARVCAHSADDWMMCDPKGTVIKPPVPVEPVSIDIPLEEGTTLQIGDITFKVIHTPGHSAGSVCLYEEREGVLFTGDTLFAGSIGRTDLPSGSYDEISKSISTKILALPENVKIFPGHGPESTLKKEKSDNPFVQMMFAER